MFEVSHSRSHNLVSSWSVIQKFHCNRGLTRYTLVRTHGTTLYRVNPNVQFSSLQSLSHVWLFATLWIIAHEASITNSWSLPKLMSIESVMPSNRCMLCRPLLLPSIFSSISVFSNKSALCIRWPKYWNFSFSISPSNVYSGLISVKVNWFALLAIQVTLKSSSITIQKHQFFGAQPSLWSNSHLCTWLLENHSFDYMDLCWQNDVYAF